MFDDLYNNRILELAADIPMVGRLNEPHGRSVKRSRLCGSSVSVELKMLDGCICEFAHVIKACALGQASSSIMARNVIGASVLELETALTQVQSMLEDNGTPPSGRFSEVKVLTPVKDFKARHASVLLTFEATLEAARAAIDYLGTSETELAEL